MMQSTSKNVHSFNIAFALLAIAAISHYTPVMAVDATVTIVPRVLGAAPTPDTPGRISVSPDTSTGNTTSNKRNSNGEIRTKELRFTFAVTGATAAGKIVPIVNDASQAESTGNAQITIDLTKEGTNIISLIYTDVTSSLTSNPLIVERDTTGPVLKSAEVVESPTTGSTLLVTFAKDDWPATVAPGSFSVNRKSQRGNFDDPVTVVSAIVDGQRIRLPFTSLAAGEYLLTVKGTTIAALLDSTGNAVGSGNGNAGEDKSLTFVVVAGRSFGEHVAFTPYAPPKKQTIPEEGFNPGDFVETRVAQLYYYRDAPRVAQIINRNIRSLNQAAVTQAERRAENSRDEADQATDERRQKEREAVRSAELARNAEQQLATAQQTLADARQLDNQIAADQAALSRLPAVPSPPTSEAPAIAAERAELNRRIAENVAFRDLNYGDRVSTARSDLAKKANEMQQSVANLREIELVKQDAVFAAESKETRERASQFRDEVTAAETDPDTYVAGDINSQDPVTQVSLSVIGEGLIQLRGPIKGINKVRTMINQIDSPVGQIKIGVFTVQVNGEQGERMEKVVGDAEGHIDLSRFLVNQSLNLLRRSIQSEAATIAEQCQLEGHYQVDRDRRYLYGFFGRDFIDELYEMDSEFLLTENKLLSLHAMDTVGFNSAMFILALAKNDVRERIVSRFLESVKTELPDAEYDFRRSSELKPHQTEKHVPSWNRTHLPVTNHYAKEDLIYEAVHRNALQRYHFRNFSSFFNTGFTNPDTMNPMQREFIRMAQIFKARLVAEIEWKQRVMERGLIEDRSNDENQKAAIMKEVHTQALNLSRDAYLALFGAHKDLQKAKDQSVNVSLAAAEFAKQSREIEEAIPRNIDLLKRGLSPNSIAEAKKPVSKLLDLKRQLISSDWLTDTEKRAVEDLTTIGPKVEGIERITLQQFSDALTENKTDEIKAAIVFTPGVQRGLSNELRRISDLWSAVSSSIQAFDTNARVAGRGKDAIAEQELLSSYRQVLSDIDKTGGSVEAKRLREITESVFNSQQNIANAEENIIYADDLAKRTRVDLDHRKLLDHLIDEQEEKFIELVEGTRSHIAIMDQYLKRLSIAMEDDFKIQFYDPAFIRVREAARGQSVNLSQVERTTILTNNRDFAKVDPQATIEFDLPKRQIAIKEAFDAAKALVEDSGALVNDPTFLAAFQMMGGSQLPATVKNIIPGQSMSTNQRDLGLVPKQQPSSPGSALQSLVPEPSVYQLETGTGFQLRPVMQPDGDSVVYDFDYMYTTNIREPVRADEKHIGRVKRHFVHTAVQTGNFELREISRYQVALKVSRTSRGVPLLEDIPLVGAVFRPAPSDDSSLQQNIIFGQTNIYPTLFDLMGLRWAQQVVDLDHLSLLESEHVVRGRQKSMRDFVFGESSRRVDAFLNVESKQLDSYRPDFHHSQTLASPHHPQGYSYPNVRIDPTGNEYERFDRRPPEMQEPPYDRYRHQPAYPERIAPQGLPQPIPPLEEVEALPLSEWQPDSRPSTSLELRKAVPWQLRPTSDVDALNQPSQFNGRSLLQNRDATYAGPSNVVPASFEQPRIPRQEHKMKRLPPVR